MTRTIAERLLAKIIIGSDGGCWLWQGAKDSHGYGHIGGKGTHRIAYELFRGVIPEGLTLDHLCRVPLCCNPWHLEAVTLKENVLRGVGISAQFARRTHCVKGHELTPDNLSKHRKWRQCKKCYRAYQKEYKARRK